MNSPKSKTIRSVSCSARTLTAAALALLLLATVSPARAQGAGKRPPEVPAAIQVPDGNRVEFHAYAVGVQVYVWNGSAWLNHPQAVLFRNEEQELTEKHAVGLHYTGPTWEYEDGSKVVGKKLAGVTVDGTAIPWLLLVAVSHAGEGRFDDVTYIQRVNTVGGLMPHAPGAYVNQEVDVPYTAEYYFYREQN